MIGKYQYVDKLEIHGITQHGAIDFLKNYRKTKRKADIELE